MTCFGASSGIFFDRNVKLEASTSYGRIVRATQVVRPLFYRTYDLLSWIATRVPIRNIIGGAAGAHISMTSCACVVLWFSTDGCHCCLLCSCRG